MSAIIIYVTSPSNEISKSLAKKLLEKKLAACVNIFPEISSVFSWEGEIKRESESLMMIKSSQSLFEELKEVVKLNHPYKVPERGKFFRSYFVSKCKLWGTLCSKIYPKV